VSNVWWTTLFHAAVMVRHLNGLDLSMHNIQRETETALMVGATPLVFETLKDGGIRLSLRIDSGVDNLFELTAEGNTLIKKTCVGMCAFHFSRHILYIESIY
jgi:hypothetical protein